MKKNNKLKEKLSTNISVKKAYEGIDKFLDGITNKKTLEKVKELVLRFNNLEADYQESLLEEMLEPFEEQMKQEEKSQGWVTCKKNGHNWNQWKKGCRMEKGIYSPPDITDFSDPNRGKEYWYEVPIWVRECKRCGSEEKKEYNDVPDEIKELRKKQEEEKKEKARLKKIEKNKQLIKKLEEETKKLEDNK